MGKVAGKPTLCKAGNTSIKHALVEALNVPLARYRFTPEKEPHRRIEAEFQAMTKEQCLFYCRRGYDCIAVVRHPLARLWSCWVDKVDRNLHRPFERMFRGQVSAGMSFGDFVRFVAQTPDEKAEQHFRSMSADLVCAGHLVPNLVLKIEDHDWWSVLRDTLKSKGIDLGPERKENASSTTDWRDAYSPELIEIASRRYRTDMEIFGYGR